MTPLILASAISLLALDAGAAASQPQAAQPVAANTSHQSDAVDPNDDPNKVICHKQAITGSRFIKRVCMTQAEWGEQERRTREFERHLGERPAAQGSGGYGGG